MILGFAQKPRSMRLAGTAQAALNAIANLAAELAVRAGP